MKSNEVCAICYRRPGAQWAGTGRCGKHQGRPVKDYRSYPMIPGIRLESPPEALAGYPIGANEIRMRWKLEGTATWSLAALDMPDAPPVEEIIDKIRLTDNLTSLIACWDNELPEEAIKRITEALEEIDPLTYMEEGTQRMVFDDGETVLKLAKNLRGLRANCREILKSDKMSDEGWRYAKAEEFGGVHLIRMEKVEGRRSWKMDVSEEGRQTKVVGNELVCFDSGGTAYEVDEYNDQIADMIDEWLDS